MHIFFKEEFLPLPNLFTLIAIFISLFFCKTHLLQNGLARTLSLGGADFCKKDFLNANNFFQKKLFFDYIYYYLFIKTTFFLSYNIFYKVIDRGLYEVVGPYGITSKVFNHSIDLNQLHSNQPF
jgi:hypothetical protein